MFNLTDYRGRIEVQHDWDIVFRSQGAGTVSVTYKHPNYAPVHGKLKCVTVDGRAKIAGQDGFEAELREGVLDVSFRNKSTDIKTKVFPPISTFTKVHNSFKIINDIDVTKGGLGASCDGDNNVFVWMTENGDVMRSFEGHKGEVYCCKFHPSDLMLMTGSADMSLKLWDVKGATCLSTFTGHTKGVTDFAFTNNDKAISVSKDGSAKIWECASSKCLRTIELTEDDFLNCCLVGHSISSDGDTTLSKVLLVGTNKGYLIATGLDDGKNVFKHQCGSPVLCCVTAFSDHQIILGTSDSELQVLDTRNTCEPVICIKESRSSINSIFSTRSGCYVATGVGSAYFLDDKFNTTKELSGPEYGCLNKIVADAHSLYTAGKDGAIRKYAIKTSETKSEM